MTFNEFGRAMYQAQLLYGIEFNDPADFEEIALQAWSFIGNKHIKLYRWFGNVNKETLTIDLPCNCDIIESVTHFGEDWNYTSNIYNNGEMNSSFTEEYIEHRKRKQHPLYSHGHYIHYDRVKDKLYFDKPYCNIQILYKGIQLDDEGLPYINDKEVIAIATFVAYVMKYKEALQTNNPNLLRIAQGLQIRWNALVDEARCPEELDQNSMDEILDVKTSWDRKVYGKSYFPLIK